MAQRLANPGEDATLLVASGATDLPFPPVVWGLVPDAWSNSEMGVVPEFDLTLRSVAAVTWTDVIVYAGKRFAVVLADAALDDGDVDVATNEFGKVAHGYKTGDGPLEVTPDVGDELMTGLAEDTAYYAIRVDADNFKIATSIANSIAGTAVDVDYATRAELDLATLAAGNIDLVVEAINPGVAGEAITLDIVFDAAGAPTLSEVGNAVTLHAKNNVTTNGLLAAVLNTSTKLRVKTDTATPGYVLQSATDNFAATNLAVATGSVGFTFAATDDAKRFYWSDILEVGTVDLDVQLSRTITVPHRPNVVAYAVGGTPGGAVATTVEGCAVVDRNG